MQQWLDRRGLNGVRDRNGQYFWFKSLKTGVDVGFRYIFCHLFGVLGQNLSNIGMKSEIVGSNNTVLCKIRGIFILQLSFSIDNS